MGRQRVDRRRVGLLAWLALIAFAASGTVALAAGPPFPDRDPRSRTVWDTADVLSVSAERAATALIRTIQERTGLRVVVFLQRKPAVQTVAEAGADARALMDQWVVGGTAGDGIVLLFDLPGKGRTGLPGMAGNAGFHARYLDRVGLDAFVADRVGSLATIDVAAAMTSGLVGLSTMRPSTSPDPSSSPGPSVPVASSTPGASASERPGPVKASGPPILPGAGPPAGPPYPAPQTDVVVYDYADVLEPATEASLTQSIAGIEQRTAAEIVVYTQVKPTSDTPEEAERDAIALIDQWGVGRKGFDDGMAILFDMDASGCHGQVQLYAAPGYRAAFLSNEERQAIFDSDMAPPLRRCDMDGAVLAAMRKVDAAATPEHAAALQQARQIDGALGLVVAPGLFLLLFGLALSSWLRYGRDPQYLDDPSILMPAPPPDLTAASGALIMDGHSTRHTLTTAMLDLASRGELAFRDESGHLSKKVGIQLLGTSDDDPAYLRARRRPLSDAERYALERLRAIPGAREAGYIAPDDLLAFGASVDGFDRKLERHVVDRGWFREPPGKAIGRWTFRGGAEVVLGVIAAIVAFHLPSGGLMLCAIAAIAAGVVTLVISRSMPARTMPGAMVHAMLAAYRRTLRATMAQARSLKQVVDSRVVPWLETPDQALVWGVALGLRDDVEQVLKRSVEDTRDRNAASSQAWLPAWYIASGSSGGRDGGGGGSAMAASGLLSASAIPDFDAMLGAVGTIGDSPSSSGSGSSGGFSGGSSGGGGGGAGGGF